MEIDWHLIFVIAIVVHAIGHFFPGFVHTSDLINLQTIFGSSAPNNESWLLSGQLNLEDSITKLISVLFLITSIGFLAVAGAFWFEVSWWKMLAVPMIVLSGVLFVMWFNSFPVNIPIGAAIGNIVVLYGVLSFN
jgi:hypothetical protein